jgi:phage gp29-like protein
MKTKALAALLETRQTYHSTQSIERWKRAINAFESITNPNRVLLYDLYEDILLDGHLEATWGKRQDAVLNRRLSFVRDGIEDDDITQLLNSPDMRELIRRLHETIAYGYTLIQINNVHFDDEQEQYRIDFDLIPRKHVHPEPDFRCVSRDQYGAQKDFLYMQPPLANYMVWAGNPNDMGLFVKVAPYVIYKRGGFGDWAQFSEMFGMPFREAIYDAYDDDTRRKIQDFMKQWSASTYLVHQRDVELKIHPTGNSAQSSEVYERLIQVCDAGISKTILGNTLTTEQGDKGARSLGEVHQDEEDDKKASDERFILSVLNTQFRAVLKRFNIPVAGGEIWFEAPDKNWSALQTKWNVISAVAGKIPVDDDYIYEEFDIPKPDNYEQIKEEMKLEKHAGLAAMFDTGAPPKNKPVNKNDDDDDDSDDDKNNKNLFARLRDFFV